MLDPAGPSAAAIARVWWWMLGVAAAVSLGVMALWLLGMRRGQDLGPDQAQRRGQRWILAGGVALPATAIAALLVFGSSSGRHQLPLPLPRGAPAPLVVEVTGHQWWWEIHYPDSGVRLKNELRIPVGRAVHVDTRSSDVIHSFWVPRLGGKLDAIPGRTLRVRLQADLPGSFRGQCAEFCGLHHAHMALVVHAMPVAEFEAWQQAEQGRAAAGGTR